MRIKWGNLLIFLLIVGGIAGYFQWERIKDSLNPMGLFSESKRGSGATEKEVIYARDSWITGGIPELGIARGYARDYGVQIRQTYLGSDDERLAAVGSGRAHFTEISFPSLLFNLERVEKGRYRDQVAVLGFIDYSRGGDGIIVRSGIRTVNDLSGKRVGFVGDGTGKYLLSFLLRMVDMRLEDVQSIPYKDEERLAADFRDGRLDAIAYWQPGINDVLKRVSGSRVLLSTADMPTLIPDLLIVNRRYLAEHADQVESFVKFWFATTKHVLERPDVAYEQWSQALNKAAYSDGGKEASLYGTENSTASLQEIFTKEVHLVGFDENLKLMGVSQPAELDQMVKFAVDNWNRIESLKRPDADTLFNRRVLDAMKDDVTLKVGAIDAQKSGNASQQQESTKTFTRNADPTKLDEVAQMAIPNIEFEPDATGITAEGRRVIDTVLVPLLRQFPNFYLLIDGHTDVGGDDATLMKLSQGRSNAVKQELIARGFPDAQMIARGFGDRNPLFRTPRTDAEKAKNRRTEFRLLRDPLSR